jgi:hypothetical protein
LVALETELNAISASFRGFVTPDGWPQSAHHTLERMGVKFRGRAAKGDTVTSEFSPALLSRESSDS